MFSHFRFSPEPDAGFSAAFRCVVGSYCLGADCYLGADVMSMYLRLNLAPSGIFPMSNRERPDLSHLGKPLRRLRVARLLTSSLPKKKSPPQFGTGLSCALLFSVRAIRRRFESC